MQGTIAEKKLQSNFCLLSYFQAFNSSIKHISLYLSCMSNLTKAWAKPSPVLQSSERHSPTASSVNGFSGTFWKTINLKH